MNFGEHNPTFKELPMEASVCNHAIINQDDFEEKVSEIRAERRASVSNFWKVICGLSTVIGILAGFLLSDLRFMGQITETKIKVESLQKQVDSNEQLTAQRFAELKNQAETYYEANHKLIQEIYNMHMTGKLK
jgi:hypothetical protein